MLPIGDLESSHQEYTSTKIKQRYIRKKNDMAVCHFMLDPMTSIGVCVCIFSIFPFYFFDILPSKLAMLLQCFVTPTENLTDFASLGIFVSPGFAHVAGVCRGAVEM